MSENLGAVLERAGRLFADRKAVVDGELRWSYRELRRRVAAFDAALDGLGLVAGDVVGVLALNSAAHLGRRPARADPSVRPGAVAGDGRVRAGYAGHAGADDDQHGRQPPRARSPRPLEPARNALRRLADADRAAAADGYLYIVDRVKDMIVSGGENVYSTEVEDAIQQHPAVLECAVFGVPDPDWGERVHAVFVLRPDADIDDTEIVAHWRRLIAGHKLPRTIDFHDQPLPKSAAGKVLKAELRQPYWAVRERQVSPSTCWFKRIVTTWWRPSGTRPIVILLPRLSRWTRMPIADGLASEVVISCSPAVTFWVVPAHRIGPQSCTRAISLHTPTASPSAWATRQSRSLPAREHLPCPPTTLTRYDPPPRFPMTAFDPSARTRIVASSAEIAGQCRS